MNAVVIYVGMRAIQAIHEKQQCITMTTIAHTAYMDIFQNLAVSLCTEGSFSIIPLFTKKFLRNVEIVDLLFQYL